MAHLKLEGAINLKEDLIASAWSAAIKAHKHPEKPFLLDKTRDSSIISFAGSSSPEAWFSASDSSFGETKIDTQLFPSVRSIGVDDYAVVNSAFLRRFQGIFGKLKEVLRVNKSVVFTGHSAGGPIAILATIWLLEQQRNPDSNPYTNFTPTCITFGSPLVGNFIFSHALKREKWSTNFVHFVTRYDIVPRIHLAPLPSLQPQLQTILNCLNSRSLGSTMNANVATEFFMTVMRNASAVVSNAACRLMGNTNLLLDTLKSFVKLSPYSPFGTYIFFTESEKVVVVSNPDAVLQILFYACQLSSESECDYIAQQSLKAHWGYESKMQQNLEQLHAIRLDELAKLPLSLTGRNTPITEALDELGLSTRALLNLRAAGAYEEQKTRNKERMELKKQYIEDRLNWLEENYRAVCKVDGFGYYDAFKLQKDPKDFQANIKRLEQAGIWDEIVEMLKRYELPEEFEGDDEWIKLGTRFRRLVEPLDIANYYRHSKNDDTGPYLIKGRPKRYRFTQRWLEHNKKMSEPSEESTLWAKVEEIRIETKTKMYAECSREIIELEKKMKRWVNEIEDDMLLKKSTFMEWWKTLPEHHRSQSCIKDDIERMVNDNDSTNMM
ncbi:protein EDS1L-like [Cucumis melo var. makuwa]|uniref:Protein EDS1L-like n=2 Tax=Cucumis melo TaxID=3656 RepID=A0A5D3BFM2_CUCMM|nr:protein EDS1L-like [Cucumis melo var. makuwa]